jgi:hypothetical protein
MPLVHAILLGNLHLNNTLNCCTSHCYYITDKFMLFNNDVSTEDITQHKMKITYKVKKLATYHNPIHGIILGCSYSQLKKKKISFKIGSE